MAPKRKATLDTAKSSRQRTARAFGPVSHMPEFYELTVQHKESKNLFGVMSKWGMDATWFVDRAMLEALEVWNGIALFFNSISWGQVLSLNFLTYESLTL